MAKSKSSKHSLTRKAVLRKLFDAAQFGNLGLFIGAGFSKAVINSKREEVALSWGQLLRASASSMDIDYTVLTEEGRSYPEIASRMCDTYAQRQACSYEEAKRKLKELLSDATAWFPSGTQRETFADNLDALRPAWIITTNYDQILECLLAGRCVPLGPKDGFISARDVIPVLHLHGSRAKPEDIVITQEDYITLFRPTEYRQVKLALTIRESTTCLIGYALGDVNVQAALDWSRNVYPNQADRYPNGVVQLLWREDPSEEAYLSPQGVIILEIDSIQSFFDEYMKHEAKWSKALQEQKIASDEITLMLETGDAANVKKFIEDQAWRRSIFEQLSNADIRIAAVFEKFLNKCFIETQRRSAQTKAFEQYGIDLTITLDLLTAFSLDAFPTVLLPVLVKNFNRLSNYIGSRMGDSWEAERVWNARRSEIASDMRREMLAIAQQHSLSFAQEKLEALAR